MLAISIYNDNGEKKGYTKMNIGEKIKKERLYQNLSQKQLAQKVGMSEPAIRNYELGNRTPSQKQVDLIANALGVSPFALSNPDLNTYYGIMHALFYLENTIDLHPIMFEGQPYLKVPAATPTSDAIKQWHEVYAKFQAEEITQEEYKEWKDTYPERVIFNKR